MTQRLAPNHIDVPETMLWTLHNRAREAARHDRIIDDPKCLEIYQALDYDYEKSFGKADMSHGVRSWLFDNKLSVFAPPPWILYGSVWTCPNLLLFVNALSCLMSTTVILA